MQGEDRCDYVDLQGRGCGRRTEKGNRCLVHWKATTHVPCRFHAHCGGWTRPTSGLCPTCGRRGIKATLLETAGLAPETRATLDSKIRRIDASLRSEHPGYDAARSEGFDPLGEEGS